MSPNTHNSNVSTNTPQLTSSPKNDRKLESVVQYSLYFVYNIIISEDQEIFTLKIIHVESFRVFVVHSIFETFLPKMFYSRVKFSWLVSTTKLF